MEENHVPQNIAEVDSLLSSIEAPSHETAQAAPEAEQPKQEPTTQAEIEYELSRKGVTQKFPLSKILGFAGQGFDYNEKMRDFNVQRQLFESERQKMTESQKRYQEIEQRLNQYKQIEDYQKQDPGWWEHVVQSYQNRSAEQGQPATLPTPIIEKLVEEKVAPFKQYITDQEERAKIIAKANEDSELNQIVTDFKSANAQYDWTSLDKQGQDLEARILKHAVDNKIQSFRAAARDYLYDEDIKRAEIKAKEAVGKDLQKATKLGLGPLKDKPNEKVARIKDVRTKSWDDVGSEALKELGLM